MGLDSLFHSIERWRAGEIDDPSYASLYFLHWQVAKHGERFASRLYKGDPRPNPALWFLELSTLEMQQASVYLRGIFERYQFFGVIGNVPKALAAWLGRAWPLTLCEHIPDSREVLRMQVEGTRPVTVLSSWPRMLKPVLTKPNAFAFMVHDLEHAWKFYHDPEMFRQQRELFRLLLMAEAEGRFDTYLVDPIFSAKFDYLISDMNTHPQHAAQFLRAILVEFHLRRENLHQSDKLTQPARDDIAGLMACLLGDEWQTDVAI